MWGRLIVITIVVLIMASFVGMGELNTTRALESEEVQEEVQEESIDKPLDKKNENEWNLGTTLVSQKEELVVVDVSSPKLTMGSSLSYRVRTSVIVTNKGSETADSIIITLPFYESGSSQQTVTLRETSHEVDGNTFYIGSLDSGSEVVVWAEFDIVVRTVSLERGGKEVDRAFEIYNRYKGSGNCRDLALQFINDCGKEGITAREVVGYARPQRGNMTVGDLKGCRHSWAEFYVEGIGWIPVDLTFGYFGDFPHHSHIIEGYGDRSIKVNYSGGDLSAVWVNEVK